LITGNDGSTYLSKVYRNDAGVFVDISAGLTGVYRSSVAWGDYDNDGDLDILITGNDGSTYLSKVYRNDAGVFVDISAGLTGVYRSSIAWGDYDQDGDLDILLTGYDDPVAYATIYRNNTATANTPPTAPTGLTAGVVTNTVTLSWNAASDTQTPANGLTYNIVITDSNGISQTVSPMADIGTGYRRIPAMGNAQHGLTATVELGGGTYTWTVQAIDSAFAGSPFAIPAVFTLTQKAPGGVTDNLQLWLKADAGVTESGVSVSVWADQSGNGKDASQATAGNQPTYVVGGVNGRPVVRFDGTDDYLDTLLDIDTDVMDKVGIFAVFKVSETGSATSGIWGNDDGGQDRFLNVQTNHTNLAISNGTTHEIASNVLTRGGWYIATSMIDEGESNGSFLYVNGVQKLNFTQSDAGGSAINFSIGRVWTGGGYFDSDIAEVSVYGLNTSGALFTATQRQQVESYLALKYGITLSNTDYLNSAGTTIWDTATNTGYLNDVAGIGIDTGSVLNQLASRSVNSDSLVTITGTVGGGMADGEFLIWGSNDAITSTNSTDVPGGYSQRLLRVWKVQETGDVGNVNISFDLTDLVASLGFDFANTGGFALLTDADGTFSNATATTGASVSGNVVTFSNVSLSNGQFFSLAYP
ncbi:MAG: VCBS repeat-containing protein, partial [Chloroflexota bacterium]